ncbi:MAG: LamG domain-containing protein [Myxococcales bacterium]|nr:LamG domain-containing protein [Myxococcales bacterium]
MRHLLLHTTLFCLACSGDPTTMGTTGPTNTPTDEGGGTTFTRPVDTGREPGGTPAPNEYTDGDSERCLLLFGSTDRVRGNDAGLPFENTPRTLQAWVRSDWAARQVAVSYGRDGVGQAFLMGIAGSGLPFMSNNGTDEVLGDASIADDEWHHMVAIWDGSLGVLMVDGETVGSGPLSGSTLTGTFTVGNLPEGASLSYPWVGWIDDVKLFGGARNPSLVTADPEGLDAESSLELWYDFEVEGEPEGAGVAISDDSGNGRDGETGGQNDHPKFPDCR